MTTFSSTVNFVIGRSKDPEPELFEAAYDLLQLVFREVRKDDGTFYSANRSYTELYKGARDAISRAVLKDSTDGFGILANAGRLDLSYEWFVLNPRWDFEERVRQRAWEKLEEARIGALRP